MTCLMLIADLFKGWKVASLILGVVMCQSMAYIVAVANLMSYLMDVLGQKLPQAAATTNLRMGVAAFTAICTAFLADAYFGRYLMVLCSTIVYLNGLLLLTLSTFSKRDIMFLFALVLITLGKAGHSPALKAFGADQLQSDNEGADNKKVQNRVNFWWVTGVFLGTASGIILLIIVESKQEWAMGYGVLALTMLVALGVFVCGTPVYKRIEPQGHIFPRASRVIVAAMLKRHCHCPSDTNQLYKGDDNQHLPHTDRLRFLDKAAIIESPSHDLEEERKKWRLCKMEEVEETKLLLCMFPMWTAFLFYGLVKSLGATFFLEQGSNLNRKVGRIEVPLPFLFVFSTLSSATISSVCKTLLKRFPDLDQVFTPPRRIGFGMLFSVFCCRTAMAVEAKRLDVVKKHGLLEKPESTVPMSFLWLVPQYFLLGTMDGFVYPGMRNFYDEQVPKSMRNFGPSFTTSVVGMGSLLIVGVIVVSDKASSQGGQLSWFADSINTSRLDYFYQTITVLCYINLVFYGFVSSAYTYKKTTAEDEPYADVIDAIGL